MENFLLSFSSVLPLILNLAIGYFMMKIKLLDEHTSDKMNTAVFKLFLPLSLFNNIYHTDISSVFNGKLTIFMISALVISFLFLMVFVPIFVKTQNQKGVIIQAIFRGNFLIFGLPVVTALCGDEKVGLTSLLIGIIVPVYNILAVICMEFFREGKVNFKKVFLGMVKNPLIIASALGIVFVALGIKIPNVFEKSITDISKVATPMSLIVLGASFTFSSLKGNTAKLIWGALGRLVFTPLVFVPVAVYLGFRGIELATVLVFLASPTAVSSYVMAKQMGGDDVLAGQYVVVCSVSAIFTVFLWIYALVSFGLI